MVGVLLGLIPIVLVAFAVAAVISYKNSGEQKERGDKMIKTVYVYLVLFATLMMTIGGTVAAFMAVADIISPPAFYQSFQEYKQMPKEPAGAQDQKLSESELKQKYDQMVADEKQRVKDRAINSLIKSFGWIIIPLPVFIYFQRRIREHPNG